MPNLQNREPSERDDSANENRSRGNLIALVFIVLLLGGGYWLFTALEKHREIGDCIASGRRDCLPLSAFDSPSP
jgi:hypothetical protein